MTIREFVWPRNRVEHDEAQPDGRLERGLEAGRFILENQGAAQFFEGGDGVGEFHCQPARGIVGCGDAMPCLDHRFGLSQERTHRNLTACCIWRLWHRAMDRATVRATRRGAGGLRSGGQSVMICVAPAAARDH